MWLHFWKKRLDAEDTESGAPFEAQGKQRAQRRNGLCFRLA